MSLKEIQKQKDISHSTMAAVNFLCDKQIYNLAESADDPSNIRYPVHIYHNDPEDGVRKALEIA